MITSCIIKFESVFGYGSYKTIFQGLRKPYTNIYNREPKLRMDIEGDSITSYYTKNYVFIIFDESTEDFVYKNYIRTI